MATSSISPVAVAVRKAGAEDVDRLRDTLNADCLDDPVLSWCYPDPARRRRILPEFFRAIVRLTLPHGWCMWRGPQR